MVSGFGAGKGLPGEVGWHLQERESENLGFIIDWLSFLFGCRFSLAAGDMLHAILVLGEETDHVPKASSLPADSSVCRSSPRSSLQGLTEQVTSAGLTEPSLRTRDTIAAGCCACCWGSLVYCCCDVGGWCSWCRTATALLHILLIMMWAFKQ